MAIAAPIPANKETSVKITYSAEPKMGLYFRTFAGDPGDEHVFSQG